MHISEFKHNSGLVALQFLDPPMRRQAEAVLWHAAIHDCEFACAMMAARNAAKAECERHETALCATPYDEDLPQ